MIDVDDVDVQIQRSDLVHFLKWKMADRCLPPPLLDLAPLQVFLLMSGFS